MAINEEENVAKRLRSTADYVELIQAEKANLFNELERLRAENRKLSVNVKFERILKCAYRMKLSEAEHSEQRARRKLIFMNKRLKTRDDLLNEMESEVDNKTSQLNEKTALLEQRSQDVEKQKWLLNELSKAAKRRYLEDKRTGRHFDQRSFEIENMKGIEKERAYNITELLFSPLR
ncbi:hypothetical protein DM02DRAFT_684017 [Periconia macrospinosa]|uniref:Uncharacterized protein n=1 Tax=Periconia macrospinosa TaxID=97972 RepID=A0A2V1E6I0_9PLEO|nr:hypothetical protein DM02DRAFT_684017 [Periconia macrospinosa]